VNQNISGNTEGSEFRVIEVARERPELKAGGGRLPLDRTYM
jgi:hypothetical protein